MPRPLTRLGRAYGAHPLHLLVLVACFALTGYVGTRLVSDPGVVRIGIWLAAAVIGHDLVLFPLYAGADRSLQAVLRMLPSARGNQTQVVSPLNYLRIPVLGSGLLLLLFLPGIIQQGQQTYLSATGQTQQPYLGRWLLLTAAMFALSAGVYTGQSRRARAPLRAAMRQLRPLLKSDERVITIAYRSEQRAGALLTTHALYYLNGDDSAVWRRIGRADIAHIQWHPDTNTLAVAGLPTAPIDHATIRLTHPGNLLKVGDGPIGPSRSDSDRRSRRSTGPGRKAKRTPQR